VICFSLARHAGQNDHSDAQGNQAHARRPEALHVRLPEFKADARGNAGRMVMTTLHFSSLSALEDPWILFAAVGFFVLFIGIREFWYGLQSLKWPSCGGTIIRSEIRQSRGPNGRANCTPHIRYVYSVGGREYASGRIGFHGLGGTSEAASQSTSLSYPVGAQVKVFYDKRKPSRATLEVGYSVTNAFMIGCGAVLSCVSLWNVLAKL
jgi:hypothetical protein